MLMMEMAIWRARGIRAGSIRASCTGAARREGEAARLSMERLEDGRVLPDPEAPGLGVRRKA